LFSEVRISPLRTYCPQHPPVTAPTGSAEQEFVVEWQLEVPSVEG